MCAGHSAGPPFILNCTDGEIINVRLYEALEKRYISLDIPNYQCMDTITLIRCLQTDIWRGRF